MRGVLALSCAAVAAAASREVHKLRAAQSACTLNFTRGPEPTKRFVVFTKQRSGSRWFVNALALRSNGTFHTHIPDIEFRGFGMINYSNTTAGATRRGGSTGMKT